MAAPLFWLGSLLVSGVVTYLATRESSTDSEQYDDPTPQGPNPASRRKGELMLDKLCRELNVANPGIAALLADPQVCYEALLESIEREAEQAATPLQRELDLLEQQQAALAALTLPTQGADHE